MRGSTSFARLVLATSHLLFRRQACALCFADEPEGRRYLLVSRKSKPGYMTFPKGTIEQGEAGVDAAVREAFEEAGVYGFIEPQVVGTFVYRKKGRIRPLVVDVYRIQVQRLEDEYPEASIRTRRWVGLREAAALLTTSLADILLQVEGTTDTSEQMPLNT